MSSFVNPLIEGAESLMRSVGRSEMESIKKMAPKAGKMLWDAIEPMKSNAELNFTSKHANRLTERLGKISKDELETINQFRVSGNQSVLHPNVVQHVAAEGPYLSNTINELGSIAKDNHRARRLLSTIDPTSGLPLLSTKDTHAVQDLTHFYKEAESILHESQTLGHKDEKAIGLLKELRAEVEAGGKSSHRSGIDQQYAKDVVEKYVGRKLYGFNTNGLSDMLPGKSKLEQATSGYMVLTNLGNAHLRHGGQFFNSVLINEAFKQNGLKPLIKATYDVFKDPKAAREFAIKSGADLYQTIKQMNLETIGDLAKDPTKWGELSARTTPNQMMSKARRTFDAVVGKRSAQEAFQKLVKNPADQDARNFLKHLFVDPDLALKQGGLSENQLLMAGKRTSDLVNFRGDATTLPSVALGTGAGQFAGLVRTISTFRRMQFQSGKFIKDYVLKPARQGNFRPMMYAAMALPMVGEIFADASSYIKQGDLSDRPGGGKGENMKNFIVDRYIDSTAHALPIGLIYDAMIAMSYNSAASIGNFLGGPVFNELEQDATIGHNLVNKDSRERGKRQAEEKFVKSIPMAGPYLYHKMHPTKSKNFLQKGVVTGLLTDTVKKGIDMFGEMAKK